MEDVNDGGIPSVFLLQLLSLKIIQYFSLLIPISLFFGIIIALNKLYVSNEMVIMKVNGYSNKLISAILTRIIVITAIIVMLFNCFITPYTVDIRSEIAPRIIHDQKIYTSAHLTYFQLLQSFFGVWRMVNDEIFDPGTYFGYLFFKDFGEISPLRWSPIWITPFFARRLKIEIPTMN